MARSSNTLSNRSAGRNKRNQKSGSSPTTDRVVSLFGEAKWVIYAALAVALAFTLFTWHPTDPGWVSTSSSQLVQNRLGMVGAYVSDILYYLVGLSAWWLVVCFAQRMWVGYRRLMKRIVLDPDLDLPRVHWEQGIGFIMLFLGSMGFEASQLQGFGEQLPGGAGGVLGGIFANNLLMLIGPSGSAIALFLLLVLGISFFFGFSWLTVAEKIGFAIQRGIAGVGDFFSARKDRKAGEAAKAVRQENLVEQKVKLTHEKPVRIEPAITSIPKSERAVKEKQQTEKQQTQFPVVSHESEGALPAIDLLDPAQDNIETVSPETIEYTSRLIEKKLRDFGVEVTVVAAQAGPVITRYEIEPATGVKGSQIVNLSKDLARALSLISIRVVETIPGKNLMGLELPNPRRQMVRLSEIIGSKTYHDNPSALTMVLGKDIAGNPVVADLAKMPHLLVAGTTGSGKSVGINAMILSLLYKADATQVRLILIDPKMLEMSIYEGIPHLLAPVVTDMRQAANALNWCVGEMEKRYKLMSKMGVRNLSGYNAKIREAIKKGEPIPNPFSLTPEAPEPLSTLPFIVVVIDELADLMMVVGKKIEELIARLAQKARASGIHLVLATQRPSVDVITGLIKANIPTRIAFQVSSKIDSRTILDQMGAETLLGQGDMLFLPPGTGLPRRVHGAFVADDEVHRVVDCLKEQGEADYIDGILEGGVPGETGDGLGSVTGFADPESDPLYDQAVAIVLKNRRASISSVQRHLRIGYNRAARLLEQMEQSGVVSAMQSNGNREILVPAGQEEG
ncbi:DNA translocase FtsK 4TM domain-containing protein [Advenella sp. WQ 585]|uniref:DNA translocase FtsK 4TM domain-containing protein n=1 Tax=Advenella mandrilli TaxID=2800330 RepID=A0ABS1EEU1_9BURK|nr:DNA translocase FtsK [Advenella mandrilli]MBK1781783.1 DNA translocase FtsK 4TM domain-containing protein [Advenella mandrilli]